MPFKKGLMSPGGQSQLADQFEQKDFKYSIVSIRHLPELKNSIQSRKAEGVFNDDFYQELMSQLDFSLPCGMTKPRSLVIVAARQPQYQFTFTWGDKEYQVIVPPAYLHVRETERQVLKILRESIGHNHYYFRMAKMPSKLLAASSGLATYGRNNIAYVPGMGSYHRLIVFFSDLPCANDTWEEARIMDLCASCTACIKSCPTGAIIEDRFIIYAEKCLTFFNEKPSNICFPNWIDASWHNCLVGCMQCMINCPGNGGLLTSIEVEEKYSIEETRILLEGSSRNQVPPRLIDKLNKHGLLEWKNVISRNLKVLIDKDR